MSSQNQNIQRSSNVDDGKLIAILSYITAIGLIIAIILNNDKKSSFAAYHIRQSLGITITSFVVGLIGVLPFIGKIAAVAGGVLTFIMLIQGLISAASGEKRPAMLLGEKYQEWFKSI